MQHLLVCSLLSVHTCFFGLLATVLVQATVFALDFWLSHGGSSSLCCLQPLVTSQALVGKVSMCCPDLSGPPTHVCSFS